MIPVFTTEQRTTLVRIFFGWILLAIVWRWMDSSMLSQLERPVLGNVYKDLTFWLFDLLGIQSALTGHFMIALAVDILLTASIIETMIRPLQPWSARVYCVTILLYFITHTTYANHHYRPIIGLLVAGLPFAFRSLQRMSWTIQALRYYVLFIYTSAGLYKIFRGSWMNLDQMTAIIENTQLELFLARPEGWHTAFFTWILQHEWAGWALFVLATVLETVFIIGYFTRRWDVLLFCTAMALHIGFFFTMRFFAFELIVLDLTLLPWHKLLSKGNDHSGPTVDPARIPGIRA